MVHVIFGLLDVAHLGCKQNTAVPCKSSSLLRPPVFAQDHSSRFFFYTKMRETSGRLMSATFFAKASFDSVWGCDYHSGKLT